MISVAKKPFRILGLSYLLAMITGYFQATFWGMTGIGELKGVAGPVAAITCIVWLLSVLWCFSASAKTGWLSLLGVIPAFTFIWVIGLLLWSCASGKGCL